MKGLFELPDGYAEIRRIDLKKDKKFTILLNVAALVLFAVMLVLGLLISPLCIPIVLTKSMNAILVFALLIVAIVAYIICHELVHGLFFRVFTGKKAKYGFNGIFAYAYSDAYVSKVPYVIIGLAPVIVFGIIFLVLNIVLPQEWFWFVYLLQIMNISGAVGDFYITYLVCKSPTDLLAHDEVPAMIFYSREKYEQQPDTDQSVHTNS